MRLALIILMVASLHGSARAEFSVIGRACMPDNASLLARRLDAAAVSGPPFMRHAASTGTITFYCPIPTNIATPFVPSHMGGSYKDEDNNGTIQFEYVAMNKSTGNLSTLASFTSATTTGFKGTDAQISDPSNYNPSVNVYFVRVTMNRTEGPHGNLTFYGATVW